MIRLFGGVIISLLPAAAFAAEEAAGGAPQNSVFGLVAPIALMIIILYFLAYRPQKKKQQQHDQMVASISRGDTVITAGGFFGKVLDILDDSYILELDDGVKARILKGSVSSKRESGEEKPRVRKIKKKRRIIRSENAPEDTVEVQRNAAAREEGVSIAENDALMEGFSESGQTDTAESSENGSEAHGEAK